MKASAVMMSGEVFVSIGMMQLCELRTEYSCGAMLAPKIEQAGSEGTDRGMS